MKRLIAGSATSAVIAASLIGATAPPATAAVAYTCTANAPTVPRNCTYTSPNSSDYTSFSVPANSSVTITLTGSKGSNGGAYSGSGAAVGAGGTGVTITVARIFNSATTLNVGFLNGGSTPQSCGAAPSSAAGKAAFLFVGNYINPDGLAAGSGGNGGCAANTSAGGNGGNAGVPTAANQVANGTDGTNGVGSTSGKAGTSASGNGYTGFAGGSDSGRNYTMTPPGDYGWGGEGQNATVSGGGGGSGYRGGGGGGAGSPVNGSSAGGGGGSSYIGPNFRFISAAASNATTAEIIVDIRNVSTDANLSNLVASAGALSPTFASGTLAYTATVPYSTTSTTLTPTTANAYASVTVNGVSVTSGSASSPVALAEGANTFTVVVTAENGSTTKTYTATITREAEPAPTPTPTPTPSPTPDPGTTPAPSPTNPSGQPIAPKPGSSDVFINGTTPPKSPTVAPVSGGIMGVTFEDPSTGTAKTVTITSQNSSGQKFPLGPKGVVQVGTGQFTTISGGGLKPGSTVAFYILPDILLGSAVVGADGNYSATMAVPATLEVKSSTIQVVGSDSDDKSVLISTGVDVVSGSSLKGQVAGKSTFKGAKLKLVKKQKKRLVQLMAKVPTGQALVTTVSAKATSKKSAKRVAKKRAKAVQKFLSAKKLNGTITIKIGKAKKLTKKKTRVVRIVMDYASTG